MIANYRVPSDLSSIESTTDGNSVVLGMVDGSLTVLTIADPNKGQHILEYLACLPSRNSGEKAKIRRKSMAVVHTERFKVKKKMENVERIDTRKKD